MLLENKSFPSIVYKFYRTLHRKFGPQHWWPAGAPFKTTAYMLEVIIGAILTQNTSWNNVEKAIANLKKADMLDIDKLNKIDIEKLKELIRPSGFFNQKARTIKNFLTFLINGYNGKLENLFSVPILILRKELLEITGIGKETADSIILYAINKPIFVVDKYTKRIFFRHNLIDSEKIEYDKLRFFIQNNIPKKVKLYNELHALLVKVGKDLCKVVPECVKCPLKTYLPAGFPVNFIKK